jgi:hypothetical protein
MVTPTKIRGVDNFSLTQAINITPQRERVAEPISNIDDEITSISKITSHDLAETIKNQSCPPPSAPPPYLNENYEIPANIYKNAALLSRFSFLDQDIKPGITFDLLCSGEISFDLNTLWQKIPPTYQQIIKTPAEGMVCILSWFYRFMQPWWSQISTLLDPSSNKFTVYLPNFNCPDINLSSQVGINHSLLSATDLIKAQIDQQSPYFERIYTFPKTGMKKTSIFVPAEHTPLHLFKKDAVFPLNQPFTVQSPLSSESEITQSFDFEFALLSQLNHPQLIPVYGQISDGSSCPKITISEYFPSETLNQVINKYHYNFFFFTKVGKQLAQVLQYLHQRQISHHDLKPNNILINFKKDQHHQLIPFIKLIDFGLNRLFAELCLDPNIIYGSTYYTPPERSQHKYSPAGDIYSFGAIMYELLTQGNIFLLDLLAKMKIIPVQHRNSSNSVADQTVIEWLYQCEHPQAKPHINSRAKILNWWATIATEVDLGDKKDDFLFTAHNFPHPQRGEAEITLPGADQIPTDLLINLQNCIKQCLAISPQKRPKIDEIVLLFEELNRTITGRKGVIFETEQFASN